MALTRIKSDQITNLSVTTQKLANLSVTTEKLADDAVTIDTDYGLITESADATDDYGTIAL
jgi:hypothetical protein